MYYGVHRFWSLTGGGERADSRNWKALMALVLWGFFRSIIILGFADLCLVLVPLGP